MALKSQRALNLQFFLLIKNTEKSCMWVFTPNCNQQEYKGKNVSKVYAHDFYTEHEIKSVKQQ